MHIRNLLSHQESQPGIGRKQRPKPVPMKSICRFAGIAMLAFASINASAADHVWTPLSNTGAPTARQEFSTVWTGTEMIVWGGRVGLIPVNTGGRYNPTTNTWSTISTTGAPIARSHQSAVWTGQRMIVWGGANDTVQYGDGASYDPTTDTWTPLASTNAPGARGDHRAVWTGDKMIVWGGYDGGYLNSGAIYNPVNDTWSPVTLTNAPAARAGGICAVWTGTEMVVFGGGNGSIYLNTGGRYNPVTNSWAATSTTNAPQGKGIFNGAVWTGSEMIVWAGSTTGGPKVNTGSRYNPSTDIWTTMSDTNAPAARDFHAVAWTGAELIVWSGAPDNGTNYGGAPIYTGGLYNPTTDTWLATPDTNTPIARRYATAVWTGTSAIFWGGSDNSQYYGDTFSLAADGDNDGVADIYETGTGIYVSPTNTGTSPTLADTDSDGLSDGTEIYQYSSNPNLADTDSDGFADGFEVVTGFSPTLATSTPEALSTMLPAVEFRFNAANGISYRIESSTDLTIWSTIENTITGTGVPVIRFYTTDGITRRFYRARRN